MNDPGKNPAAARRSRPLVLLLAALLFLLPTLRAHAVRVDDHDLWYVIEMAGKRSGWMHAAQKTAEDRITTTSEMRLILMRGSEGMTISISSSFVETVGGKPVSMKCTQSLGAPARTDEYTFKDDGITVLSRTGSEEPTEKTVPLPKGAWLTPAASAEFIRKRLEAGATTIDLRTVDPMSGPKTITSETTVLERTTIEALGRTIPAIRVEEVSSALPQIKSVNYIDERGLPIRTKFNLGSIPMTIVIADKDLALSELDPAEVMQRTFVTPDRKIPGARRLRRAEYLLSVPDGEMPALPAAAWQRVEPVDARTVRVVIDRGASEPASASAAPAPAADGANAEFTSPSDMLNSADPEIRKLVERATAEAGDDKLKRAETMRRFVYRYITRKDLSVGFGSASEVARSREGDCSEHGCLLAAMLRADGIPSRAVSGLIYADQLGGAFGYHMWTQGLFEIDGKRCWIDLDATLAPSTPFDATHIALVVTSLADDQPQNPLVAIVPLLGRLAIKVERAGE